MNFDRLLDRHRRACAESLAARLAGRLVLAGALLVAVALFVDRLGIATPLTALPRIEGAPGSFTRVFSYVAVSLTGLVQGAVLLAGLFAAALAVRLGMPALLRPGRERVAAALDRQLATDRFSSALEAQGPLAGRVRREAVTRPPSEEVLCLPPLRRTERVLRALAVLLVFLVAIAPGRAGGEPGDALVPGRPGRDRGPRTLRLRLEGARRTFGVNEPVHVQIVLEASEAPDADLDLPVRVGIDGGEGVDLSERLFLAAGAPGLDAVVADLRRLAGRLAPGEHVAIARAGILESNEFRFRIEAEGSGGGGADEAPPAPRPEPQPRPGAQPRGAPSPDWRPRFVEPLVRDGEQVRKRARVPIEVPGGGVPREHTLEQAWPELERRKEAALDRPGLSPASRKLVREYFERLRPAPR